MAAKKEAKKVNLRPLADRVVVEPIEREEVTPSGIVIPETAKERPRRGWSWPWGRASWTSRGRESPWRSKKGTGSSSPNMPERR